MSGSCFLVICFITVVSAMLETTQILSSMRIVLDQGCVRQNIGYKTYNEMNTEVFKDCVGDVEDNVRSRATGNEPLDEVVNKFCGSNEPTLCHDIVEQKLNVCLSDLQRDHLKYTKKAGLEILKYVCKDNGAVIRGLRGMSCDAEADVSAKYAKCRSYLPSEVPIQLESLYADTCGKYKRHIRCLPHVYKSCENKAMFNYVSETGKIILNSMPCGCNPTSSLSVALLLMLFSIAAVQNILF